MTLPAAAPPFAADAMLARLARWLLGNDPPAASVPEQHVLLPKPVPITISYLDAGDQLKLASLI